MFACEHGSYAKCVRVERSVLYMVILIHSVSIELHGFIKGLCNSMSGSAFILTF